MSRFKQLYCAGIVLTLLMLQPVSAGAEEEYYSRPSERIQSDEDGHSFVMQDETKYTGRFTLTPNYLMGDVNRDDLVNAKDAAEILSAAAAQGAGIVSAEEYIKEEINAYSDEKEVLLFSDIDANGINASDAAKVLVYCAEKGAGRNPALMGSSSYYADAEGNLLTGWIQDGDNFYYAQENYELYTGFQQIEELFCHFAEDGTLSKGWFMKDGNTYYADENGAVLKGFQTIEETLCFFNEKGILSKGWFTENENTYYADENGAVLKGFQTIGNHCYYFSGEGILSKGWFTENENTYYADENGIVLKGFQTIEETLCFFNEKGILSKGWFTENENTYYADENGAVLKGFQTIEETLCFFDEKGILSKGWFTENENTYYADENGAVLKGFQTIGNHCYYFSGEGILSKGWFTENENTYYADENGIVLKGLQTIENNRYYFSGEGILCKGKFTEEENTYYADENGILQTEWQKIGRKKYYFYPESCAMAVNTEADGISLGEDGSAYSEKLLTNRQRAQTAFANNGSSVSSIYSYVRSTIRYKYIESTRTLEQIEANGWLYYVDYSFTHSKGVCYYIAAKMDFLLSEAGYTCRIVHATHGSGDHYWNQVYIDGNWVNYDCTNGYNAYSWNSIINAGSYIFLGYVELGLSVKSIFDGGIMMKKNYHIITFFMSAVLLGTFCGCEKKTETVSNEPNQVFTQKAETSFSSETISESETVKESVSETAKPKETISETVSETVQITETKTESETTAVSESKAETQSTTAPVQETSGQTAVQQETQQETVQEEIIQQQEEVQTEPVQQQTEAPAEQPTEAPTEPEKTVSSDLTVQYKGQSVKVGDSAEAFVNAVKPNFEESAPSCYGDGENINYYYDDITLYVWNQNGSYLLYSIDINASGIGQAGGYDVQDSVDFEGEKVIDCGNDLNIVLTAADGKILSISYNKNL